MEMRAVTVTAVAMMTWGAEALLDNSIYRLDAGKQFAGVSEQGWFFLISFIDDVLKPSSAPDR